MRRGELVSSVPSPLHPYAYTFLTLLTPSSSSSRSWKETEEELDVYKDRALFYVASDDNNVISWFCSKYKHVVAFDTEERTGGDAKALASLEMEGEEDDMAEGKGHQVASLIEVRGNI